MNGFILNEDNSHYFGNRGEDGANDSKLAELVQHYCHDQCGEVVYNVNSMRSSVDGLPFDPIWHRIVDRGDEGLFLQLPADTDGTKQEFKIPDRSARWVRGAKKLHDIGKDPYEFWIRETRKTGRRASISIRMNDIHCVDDENNFMHSDFWRKHPEFRREQKMYHGWDSYALDFSHKEVREYALSMVKAVLDRYDLDGLELDWMRFGHSIRPGFEDETRDLLTQFQRDVRTFARGTEKKLGHSVTISVRCPSIPQEAFDLGYDIVQWANENLIDRIVPSPFFTTNDFEIPVAFWRKILPANIKIDTGLELRIVPFPDSDHIMTSPAVVCGLASSYLYQGADRIYLFNYMDSDTCMPQGYDKIFTRLGNLDDAARSERRHILTFADRISCGSRVQSVLPQICGAGTNSGYLRIDIGPAPEKERLCELVIGLEGDAADLVPHLNGIELEKETVSVNEKNIQSGDGFKPYATLQHIPLSTKTILTFDASKAVKSGRNVFWFVNKSDTDAKITWAEIHIGEKKP